MKAPRDLTCLTLAINTIATTNRQEQLWKNTESSKNKDIVILRPDKGNGVVIMDKITYKLKMQELLNDESKFKQLTIDPTKLRESQLQCFLQKLNNKGFFDESTLRCLIDIPPVPPLFTPLLINFSNIFHPGHSYSNPPPRQLILKQSPV